MLKIERLSKSYGTKKIIDDVSLQIDKGHIAVLLGQSGVGKSTLLRILNNLETIDSGAVYLNGKLLDLSTINQTHVIGMVFQHFSLFEHLTAQENITLSLIHVMHKSKKEAGAIAVNLLTHYGLADKANHYPAQLSGGQKQRLALARTIATRPHVICLDEPTSALDPLLTTYVAKNITDLAREGFIVLVASHDISLLNQLDCTIHLMQEGRIIEQASSRDFHTNKASYPRINHFVTGGNSP